MDGKNRRHNRAAPQAASHLPQHQEQQHRVGGVPENIDQVMPARAHSEELAIQHVGKRGERNPIVGLRVREGPADSLDGQTFAHYRILVNILLVIVIDERELRRLPEDDQNGQHEENADARHPPGGRFFVLITVCFFIEPAAHLPSSLKVSSNILSACAPQSQAFGLPVVARVLVFKFGGVKVINVSSSEAAQQIVKFAAIRFS